jgi:hypothetical protein
LALVQYHRCWEVVKLDDLKIGALLEEMMLTEGWEYIEGWIKHREKILTSALKNRKFTDISEVKELQAELKAYAMLISEVRHRVEQARKAREKLN